MDVDFMRVFACFSISIEKTELVTVTAYCCGVQLNDLHQVPVLAYSVVVTVSSFSGLKVPTNCIRLQNP